MTKERLTEKVGEHFIARQERLNGKIVGNQTCLDKLGELEDAEEQGLLIILPCKEGDTLYRIVDCGTRMDTCETDCYSCKKECPYEGREDERVFKIVPWKMESVSTIVLAMEQLGKTVFLSRKEAESALAEYRTSIDYHILRTEYVEQLLREEHLWKAGESDSFAVEMSGKEWEFTLRREEPEYMPFKFSLEGKVNGTNEGWGRRYPSMAAALLHIVNHLNENAAIKNRYGSIEEWLEERRCLQ